MSALDRLPATRHFREVFRCAAQEHQLQIDSSKTRNYTGGFYNLLRFLDDDPEGWNSYGIYLTKLRTVTFYVRRCEQNQIDLALDKVQVYFLLAGKRLNWKITEHGKQHWAVSITCVIS